MAKCKHAEVPGKKPGTYKCKNCSWTFPCKDTTCGHTDCIEFRETPPKCYVCGKGVEGPAQNVRCSNSSYSLLTERSETGTWMVRGVHGQARAGHVDCFKDIRES